MSCETVILTDTPEVAGLKLEYRRLDQQEQDLKAQMATVPFVAFDWSALENVREAKRQIAVKIFNA